MEIKPKYIQRKSFNGQEKWTILAYKQQSSIIRISNIKYQSKSVSPVLMLPSQAAEPECETRTTMLYIAAVLRSLSFTNTALHWNMTTLGSENTYVLLQDHHRCLEWQARLQDAEREQKTHVTTQHNANKQQHGLVRINK